jgi:glycerol kinase
MVESTALGAAFLAGLSAGLWHEPGEAAKLRETDALFQPEGDEENAASLWRTWRRAVERAARWAEGD